MGRVRGRAANKRTSHRGRLFRQRAFANHLKVIYVVFLLLALPAAAVLPQRFTRFSVEQGLSQSTVQAILQDRRGFIWFGTEEGLNRYDGYSFVVFKNDPRDAKSLPDNTISTLHEDRQGRLWVGTWKGLSLFDYRAETFTTIPQIHKRVAAILEDADGTLWVATEEKVSWSEVLMKARSIRNHTGRKTPIVFGPTTYLPFFGTIRGDYGSAALMPVLIALMKPAGNSSITRRTLGMSVASRLTKFGSWPKMARERSGLLLMVAV